MSPITLAFAVKKAIFGMVLSRIGMGPPGVKGDNTIGCRFFTLDTSHKARRPANKGHAVEAVSVNSRD